MNRYLTQSRVARPSVPLAGRLVASRSGLGVILIIFVALGLLYDVTVPFFEKPDELKHFAMIQLIQTRHRLPVVRPGVVTLWDQEGTQPPLYHLLAAAAMSWLDLSGFKEPPRNPHYADDRSFAWRERGNNNLYLHAPAETWSTAPIFLAARIARWLSMLAGLATVFLTYCLARLVFTGEAETPGPAQTGLPLLAAALVACLPQFLHVSSAISNDGLSVTVAAAGLFILALIIRHGGSARYAFFLGLVLGLAAITKLSLLYLAPLAGLVLLFDFVRHHSAGRLLGQGVIIAGLVLLLAGWWYWRNWQLYGDVTALNAHLLYRGGALNPRPSLVQLWETELTGLELSFWAAFGAGHILLESWLYAVLRWVKYLVLLGLILGLLRSLQAGWTARQKQVSRVEAGDGKDGPASSPTTMASTLASPSSPALILVMLVLWSLIIFVALLRWMQITPASWGRLLFPSLPALAVLAVWGLSQFSWPLTRPTPGPSPLLTLYRSRFVPLALPLLLVLALFLLALLSPFRYIRAAYAKMPLISEAEVPTEGLERLNLVYDGALKLIGYRVEKIAVQPGDWLPVTLYWQPVRSVTKNYSAFVHLLGRNQAVIGQVNTYPDRGNWPTSLLVPGLVLPDTYYVPVSPQAEAPAVIRLAVGLFEFEDPFRTAKVAIDPAGQVVQPIVGAVPLLPSQWPELHPSVPIQVNFAGQIRLVGYDWPAGEKIKPGTRVPITFYWESLAAPGQNLTLFIQLTDTATQVQAAGFDGPPDFSTAYWQPGYTLLDSRQLSVPADLPPGNYTLLIGWYQPDTLTRLPLMGTAGDAVRLLGLRVEP